MSKVTISAVIPTFNSQNMIKECLNSLRWLDEVIVVDGASTDSTIEICKGFSNVKIFQNKDYIFGNINYGIEKASSNWILRFDSDEVMTQELENEIVTILNKPDVSFDGFYCQARIFMFNKELKHGVGRHTFRKQLFRKGYAWYEVKREHEEMASKGKWGYLKNAYKHYNYRNIDEFYSKTKYYIKKDLERTPPINSPFILSTLYRCIRFFMLYYIQWQGFRDGWTGLLSSFLRGPYYIWQEDNAKTKFLKQKSRN